MSKALAYLDPAINSSSTISAVTVMAGSSFTIQAVPNADALAAIAPYGSSYPITYSIHTAKGSCNINQHRASNGDVCTVEIPANTTAGNFVVRATYSGNPKAGSITVADFTITVAVLAAAFDKNIVLADGALTATNTATTSVGSDSIVFSILEDSPSSSISSTTGVLTVGTDDEYLTVRAASATVPELYIDLPFHATLLGTALAASASAGATADGINEVAASGDEILPFDAPSSGDDGKIAIVRSSAGNEGIAFFNAKFIDTDGASKDYIHFVDDSEAVFMIEKSGSDYLLHCISRSASTKAGNKF